MTSSSSSKSFFDLIGDVGSFLPGLTWQALIVLLLFLADWLPASIDHAAIPLIVGGLGMAIKLIQVIALGQAVATEPSVPDGVSFSAQVSGSTETRYAVAESRAKILLF